MKVLLVSNGSLNKTGVPCLILELAKILISDNHEVHIICFSENGNDILNKFKQLQVKVWFKPNLKSTRKIIYFLKKNGPFDVIHCFNEYQSLPFLKGAKKTKIPIRIIHTNSAVHDSNHLIKNVYFKIIKSRVIKYSTLKLGCSEDACISAYGKKAKYIVFPNPYDETIYKYHSISFDPSPISLVQVGSIQPNKNQFFSIQILEELVKSYPQSTLYIIGNTFYKDYLSNIKQYIEMHNLVSNVKLIDFDANQIEYFDKSDYMIFPSKKEGFGTVLLEAQSVGLKCIASSSIPSTTNFGGVLYLNLEDGAIEWAKRIIADYLNGGSKRKKYNVDIHKKENLVKIIRNIYAKQ